MSVPYIIPDSETEKILLKKETWMLRLFLGSLILGQPFLFEWKPEITQDPYWFLIFLVIIIAINWVIGKFVFARDLKNLKRAETNVGFKFFYMQVAQKHSKIKLVIGLIGCALFVAVGLWMLATGKNWAAGIVSVAFFGHTAVAWGFALNLKMKFKNPAD